MATKPTRMQHYVPQAYLKHWYGPQDGLAVSVNGKVIPNAGTRTFAVERDFYAFVDLTAQELDFFYRMVMQIMQPEHPLINAIVVPIFWYVLFRRCQKKDWSVEYENVYDKFVALPIKPEFKSTYSFLINVIREQQELPSGVEKNIEQAYASGAEAIECCIENAAWPVIDQILNDDLSCLKDPKSLGHLLRYIVNQCFRGPEYLEHAKNSLPSDVTKDGGTANLAHYVRLIQPFYIAHNLVSQKNERKVVVVTNMTDLEFITSDTPYAIYGERKNANTPLITYFPLSPTKGLFYGYRSGVNKFVSTYGRAVRDRNLIDWLNREVVSTAAKFVFASSEEILTKNGYHANTITTPQYVRTACYERH